MQKNRIGKGQGQNGTLPQAPTSTTATGKIKYILYKTLNYNYHKTNYNNSIFNPEENYIKILINIPIENI
jgi:hypothetical protein